MDDKEIDKIKEIVREAIDEAIAKAPTPKDEAVSLFSADGRRVELSSSQENVDSLLIKASIKLKELKNPTTKHIGHKGDPLSLGYVS